MEKELQQAIANANRLRRELPHLIQPSQSDRHMVLLHDYIKDLTADLARLTAELERRQRECEGLRADAERFRYLQNIDKKEAQAFFWHFESRKQRAKAIDAASNNATEAQ